MRDSLRKHNSSHESRINIKASWDINHWCDEFNLKADELKEIVKRVGSKTEDVKHHLSKRGPGTMSGTKGRSY